MKLTFSMKILNLFRKKFKINKILPPNRHLEVFENNLWKIVQYTKLAKYSLRGNEHLKKLKSLVCNLKSKNGSIVQYDKAKNLYDLDLLRKKEISSNYKVISKNVLMSINYKTKKITNDYELDDSTEPFVPMRP